MSERKSITVKETEGYRLNVLKDTFCGNIDYYLEIEDLIEPFNEPKVYRFSKNELTKLKEAINKITA